MKYVNVCAGQKMLKRKLLLTVVLFLTLLPFSNAQVIELFGLGVSLLGRTDPFEKLKKNKDGSYEFPAKHVEQYLSVFFEKKDVLKTRMVQTRKFVEPELPKVLENIDSALKDISFSRHSYYEGFGTAFGEKYTLTYWIRETPTGVIIRGLIKNNKTNEDASNEEYRAFWKALQTNKFLISLEIDPKEVM